MVTVDKFEGQICGVMEILLETAVTEFSKLLDGCSNMDSAATPATDVKSKEEASQKSPPEGRHKFSDHIKEQFASLMETLTKAAAAKITMMLKVSLCEISEDAAAVEQSTGLPDMMKQAKINTEVQEITRSSQETVASSSQEKPMEIQSAQQKEKPQTEEPQTELQTEAAESLSSPGAASCEESNVECPSEPEAPLDPEPALDASEDLVQEDAEPSCATSETGKKKSGGPFKCPSCDKTFRVKCLMERHYLCHSKPHQCPECGKRFSVMRGLIGHKRRHTGEKLYKCSKCETQFSHKSSFVRHMRQHNSDSNSDSNSNSKTKTPRMLTHTCTLCESQFPGAAALQRHICSALKKTFVCSLCPETFECRQSLADHENLHSGERNFVCEMCGERFFSSSSLAIHRVTHTQKETCCEALGVGCSDISVLKNHLSKHTGEKLFTCEVCGKGCSHRSALKHHMMRHTQERPYICETCGKRCSHASGLQNHMKTHNGKKAGQKPICGECGKKFRCMVNLKYHMSVHTGERPYQCDQCDKKFSSPSNLRTHMGVHLGLKKYGCNICGKRFTQSNSLKQHRKIHTGDRPYVCTACGKGFIKNYDLRKHEKNHMPPKPEGHTEKTAEC